MRFVEKLFYKLKKLFLKDYNTFAVKIFINIPTQPKKQKPYTPKKRLEQKSLFD